jgi:hypothetical protein
MASKLRVLKISEARQFALLQGLIPYRAKDTDKDEGEKLGFAKVLLKGQKKLDWMELEKTLHKRKKVICEIGGYMKILDSDNLRETRPDPSAANKV